MQRWRGYADRLGREALHSSLEPYIRLPGSPLSLSVGSSLFALGDVETPHPRTLPAKNYLFLNP